MKCIECASDNIKLRTRLFIDTCQVLPYPFCERCGLIYDEILSWELYKQTPIFKFLRYIKHRMR